ncbi:YbaB/EbfC family nucleoid-associated protein [Helicobacter equorum]|uniref:Nucleoid-associated protein CQA54_08295 n=1 Tax=Helicobacter equorum TaxID=361872 RepID=A0A3D8IL74_9HELI|nr:YbaB/EbfC family nucleoid-associated protein [Helicobacter equorum]MCI6313753.1 YbaB/EbfC family nucleoid-associated protein [Helicobacter sp.]MCI7710544.1 YbaB/EbfC family nucleoid-associated protein [Helicobacter sp.]MDD7345651.1 YbaB/EbfC family nucleoid-associated protein [Helicobacter sp.]MDY2824020.1 YbaB/EbfC family nucleoid-associated protein [Helicobacter sp.]RDU65948.1 nucleoid-associated protein, YbaB/EbfC family [Helicobacter equorum]
MFDPKQLGAMFGNIQESLQEFANKNKDMVFTAKSGGGLIEVSINGVGEVVDIKIDDSLLEDKDSLQILLIGALNDAYKNVEQNKQKSAFDMLGNFDMFKK